jgi:hypothetical protein
MDLNNQASITETPKERRHLMSKLIRISPGSAFKVGFATYALLLGIVGLLGILLALAGLGAISDLLEIVDVGAGIVGLLIGYVISVVVYGIIGGVGSAITAVIYNVVAGWTGGLEIELS